MTVDAVDYWPLAGAAEAGRAVDARSIVTLVGIGVEIERVPVLREFSLQVDPGEVVGVVGANGCGKTTLLRLLATLVVPSAGTGTVLGAAIGGRGCWAVRPLIGLVGHVSGLHPQLSLVENLRFVARLTGHPDASAERALAEVGLEGAAKRRAEQCSQGMLRRVELARILLTAPQLLLLDEPYTGLDEWSFGLVDLVIDRCKASGGATVLVSHDVGRLVCRAGRIVEVVDGHSVERATIGHRLNDVRLS